MLSNVQTEIDNVVAGINKAFANTTVLESAATTEVTVANVADVDHKQLTTQLQKLLALVKQCGASAATELANVGQFFDQHKPNEYSELARVIDDFDFDSAEQLIDLWLKKLG